MSVHFSSKTDQWATPQSFFDKLALRYGPFDLDPCADDSNAKVPHYYTQADDGLTKPWKGRVFMNPPYGDPQHPCKPTCTKQLCKKRGYHSQDYIAGIREWVAKAHAESRGGALVVCLLPARTDTRWWHDYVIPFGKVEFIRGRLKFGDSKNSAPFPSAVVVFGDNSCG